MTPVAPDRPAAAAPTPRRPDRAAEPEQRARFEDALARREPKQAGKATTGEPPLPDPSLAGRLSHPGFDLMQGGGHRERGGRDPEATALDGLRPAPTTTAAAPADAPPPPAATPLPAPTHADIAARLDLPAQPAGGEFQLSMSDTRWLASHAVVTRAPEGGLSLDVATNGEGGGEAQRAELRARLEARGHRIDRIDFAR